MQGDFAALNGHEYVVANATANTFELTGTDGSGYGAYTSGGVVSLADNGAQRLRNISLHGCIAQDCPISALTMIQANNSRDLELSSSDFFIEGFKAYNSGNTYSSEWGVINSSASVGIHGDIQVYNDVNHPVGAVFRGSMHKWHIRGIVDVWECDSLIDATPLVAVDGLDGGIAAFPEGTCQECSFDITFINETLNTAVITTTNISGSIDYLYRNVYNIRLTGHDYLTTNAFSGTLVSNATHLSNYGTFTDLPSGRVISFNFNLPIAFDNAGTAYAGLTLDNRATGTTQLSMQMSGSTTTARYATLDGSTLKGAIDYTKADNRFRMYLNGAQEYQFTANNILPNTDNTKDLGAASLSFRDIYSYSYSDADGLQVLGYRQTGWGSPTGTADRTAFDSATVTLEELAQRVTAIIDDLSTHGIIGA